MLSDEEKKEYEEAKLYLTHTGLDDFNLEKYQSENRIWAIQTILNLIEKQSKEIERLKDKLNKIYNEIDNKNSQLVKALNYKLFMEDKIKAKIEEVDKDENASIPDFIEYAKEYATQKLQSLLKEE